jgi:hypothetical protein
MMKNKFKTLGESVIEEVKGGTVTPLINPVRLPILPYIHPAVK